MYDVQVMLKEAIEKCKDIEVCGSKEILVDYLRTCINDNISYTRHWLYLTYLHKIDSEILLFEDYWDNCTHYAEYRNKLLEYIKTNPSLYKEAVSCFEETRKEVVDVYKYRNIDITISDVYGEINSVDYFIEYDKMLEENSNENYN